MKLWRKVAATAAIAVLGTGLMATPAHAGTTGSACSKASGSYKYCAAGVVFMDEGEKFYVYDNEADGAGAFVYWYRAGVAQGSMYWGGGAGTYHVFDKSAAEGVIVRFYVCVETNDNVPIGTCSDDVYATA
jgi:hypothetical protein